MASPNLLNDPAADLTDCDREPIHIPGSIQPHGLLLIADAVSRIVVAGAGAIEERLAPDWLDRTLDDLLGQDVGVLAAQMAATPGGKGVGTSLTIADARWSLLLHRAGDRLLAELEPLPGEPIGAIALMNRLDVIAGSFERAPDLQSLCERATAAFRQLTGFDRVMLYRFLDDDAGRVVAEDRDPELGTFLNHHFPASDIPRQARALYVRNRTRAIPDVDYAPAPIRPAAYRDTDLSDVGVRSVSPIHIRYLHNMGVGASASISIVKDGLLWGLMACHHSTPHALPADIRQGAAMLASSFARQVRAKEEAETYRERLRLRGAEDGVSARLADAPSLEDGVRATAPELRTMLGGDRLALVTATQIVGDGDLPPAEVLCELAARVRQRSLTEPFVTRELGAVWPDLQARMPGLAGVLAMPLADGDATLIWLRIERIEEIEWAGNPHKAVVAQPGQMLHPRASFATWVEAVRGCSRRWTLEEQEGARRLSRTFAQAHQARDMRALNAALTRTLADKEALLAQKDLLMKEVDHRVQNSLQLVSAFLSVQARAAGQGAVAEQLTEAQARLSAVALVHRRLYRDDQINSVDLARYIEELTADMRTSLGAEWAAMIRVDVAPVLIQTDRAINIGLILTELVINASKYAYGGRAGPIAISLEQYRNRARLIVADDGRGIDDGDTGFGSRMMKAMVARLDGEFTVDDNRPGVRAILTVPLDAD